MGRPFPTQGKADALFGTAATVSSVFASFLGVSKAIVLSIKTTEVYKILQKGNYTNLLFGYLRSGIFASVIFAALSIVGFFISDVRMILGYKIIDVFTLIWTFCGSLALFTYLRISNVLFKLLKVA